MNRLTGQFFQTLTCLLVVSTTWASSPKFTIVPATAGGNNLPVIKGGTAEVVYIVTNNLPSTKTLAMQPIANVTQKTQGANRCKSPFTLAHGASCELRLRVNTQNMTVDTVQVGGPEICITAGSTLSCAQPSQSDLLNVTVLASADATLSFSSSTSQSSQDLTLATNGIFTALSGAGVATSQQRTLTVTNLGPATASDVTYVFSPPLPTGTTMTGGCSPLSLGASCALTITPGTTPTASAGDEPTPSVMTVQGSNTNSIKSDVIVLTYGNQYQAGYVYSIDDTTPVTESVQGTVTQLTPSMNKVEWVSPGIYTGPVASISETSFSGLTAGVTNTKQIIEYTSPNTTAASACANLGDGWYLPAICQISYNPFQYYLNPSPPPAGPTPCGTSINPLIQNMQSNLPNGAQISQQAWSSTISTYDTFGQMAWEAYPSSQGFITYNYFVTNPIYLYCSRELTQPVE